MKSLMLLKKLINGILLCLKKRFITENFSINIIQEEIKLFHIIGFLNGLAMSLTHLLEC